jgi:hypothetical protein
MELKNKKTKLSLIGEFDGVTIVQISPEVSKVKDSTWKLYMQITNVLSFILAMFCNLGAGFFASDDADLSANSSVGILI